MYLSYMYLYMHMPFSGKLCNAIAQSEQCVTAFLLLSLNSH